MRTCPAEERIGSRRTAWATLTRVVVAIVALASPLCVHTAARAAVATDPIGPPAANPHETLRLGEALVRSTTQKSVSPGLVAQFIGAFFPVLDLTVPVAEGDRIDLLPEPKSGQLAAASVSIGGSAVALYHFTASDGSDGYYDADGHSADTVLSRKPLRNATFSAGVGVRRHPILGYTRFHPGVDWLAKRGEPVYAGGAGEILEASFEGGLGNVVRIRHDGDFETCYAHLDRFAPGLIVGSEVRRGDLIGFVGSSGASSGFHLHYEVRKGADVVDPLYGSLPALKVLSGADLDRFTAERAKLDAGLNEGAVRIELD